MSAEAQNLERIVQSIADHNARCAFPATAIAMNPFEIERLGWDEIAGLPIEPDPKLGTGSFRVLCDKPEASPAESTTKEVVHA